jgi:phosphoribosyl-ATP pyrophosphohydrolase
MEAESWKLLFDAYEFIKLGVPSGQSNTARLLRDPDWPLLRARLADELTELAGVLDGTHQHHGLPDDLMLETSQVCYWAFVCAHAAGIGFEEIRPTENERDGMNTASLSRCLCELAAQVSSEAAGPPSAASLRECWQAVVDACAAFGIDTAAPAHYDLEQMRSRGYMQPYFNLDTARQDL